jgi:serine O-acetyltransferase
LRYHKAMESSPRVIHAPAAPADERIADLVRQLVRSYHDDPRIDHLDAIFLPNRDATIEIIELIRRLLFPGFFDQQRLTSATISYHTGELLTKIHQNLYDQVRQALRYEENRIAKGAGDVCDHCDGRAQELTIKFLDRLPQLRRMVSLDVQAAYDGDPAAVSTDETIFCYPGVDAIFIYRIAHELHGLQVPLLPRIMSEYAHNETGIDIHPGATIGESFFIDHGTGVVIGETTVIGRNVKLYQGVTLGALSTKGGQSWRGRKRHPTIEDDVTIYPGATILGGETVIGARCVINGSVFLTHSVPPDHTVRIDHPPPQLRPRRKRGAEAHQDDALDFQI